MQQAPTTLNSWYRIPKRNLTEERQAQLKELFTITPTQNNFITGEPLPSGIQYHVRFKCSSLLLEGN